MFNPISKENVLQNQNYYVTENLNVWLKIKSMDFEKEHYQEILIGTHNGTQHQKNAHPKTSPIDCDGVQMTTE